MAESENKKTKRAWRFKAAATLTVIGATAGVAALIVTERSNVAAERTQLEQEDRLGPRVEVTTATPGPKEREIRLFSDVRPYQEVTLYGKVSGYLKTLAVDKGAVVKQGQFIAEIASPETDAQYVSATADLANKKALAERNDRLFKIGAVSREVAEQADTNYQLAQATLSQLETLKSYERLTAPFAGKVTARYADVGALVQNAANSQTSALPVVTISDISRLRVNAYVQQQDAPFVHIGDMADIVDAANPSRKITARVSRTSGTLDPRTRTLLVEIDIDNNKDFFIGGSFAYVSLHMKVPTEPQVPVNALVVRDNQQFLAVPDEGNVVHFRAVQIASTEGGVVRIASGILPGQKVVVNVPDELSDGSHIQPVPAVND